MCAGAKYPRLEVIYVGVARNHSSESLKERHRQIFSLPTKKKHRRKVLKWAISVLFM